MRKQLKNHALSFKPARHVIIKNQYAKKALDICAEISGQTVSIIN